MYVVSWTKGLRYRSNHKQCRESRDVVGSINVSSVLQVNSFVEKAYVTLATSLRGTHAWWGSKKQRDASPGGISWEVIHCELRSQRE